MARWKLITPHYLKVPGTEWEYKETSQVTGKQVKHSFAVPLFLNPDDPSDQNYRETGEIIVAHADAEHQGRDIIFEGPPTPDMEPLDDEARAISDSLRAGWAHPVESLPGTFTQSILGDLEKMLNEKMAIRKDAPATASIPADEFEKLKEQVAALVARNAELEAERPARRA